MKIASAFSIALAITAVSAAAGTAEPVSPVCSIAPPRM